MSNSLQSELKQMIVERLFLDRKGIQPEDIADDADLMDAFGIDSVELFEIVVGVEEDYGVAVAAFEGAGVCDAVYGSVGPRKVA